MQTSGVIMQTFVYKDKEVKLTGRVARPKKSGVPAQQRRIQTTPSQPQQLVEVETVNDNMPIEKMWVKEDELFEVIDKTNEQVVE